MCRPEDYIHEDQPVRNGCRDHPVLAVEDCPLCRFQTLLDQVPDWSSDRPYIDQLDPAPPWDSTPYAKEDA